MLDLGCGEGKVTAEIAARLPSGSVLGLDLSREMIAFAREHHPPDRYPNLRFVEGDMLDLPFDREFDVVFSNAALHWVPDHPRVFSGIARALRPGGRFLLQMGGKGNAAPILALVDGMIAGEPWKQFFGGPPPRYAFYGPEEERRRLTAAGLTPVRVELIDKDMVFDEATGRRAGARAPEVRVSTDRRVRLPERQELEKTRSVFGTGARAPEVRLATGLAGWIRTTWLLYLDRLPKEARPAFVAEVVSRYVERYPSPDGRVHVPMVRLEVEAVKPLE